LWGIDHNLKIQRDLQNSFNTKFEEGKRAGRLEAKLEGKREVAYEVARKAKSIGLSVEKIASMTGLLEDEISAL